MSEKTRKRYEEAKPIRDALRDECMNGEGCEICGRLNVTLDIHEICRGVHRQKALDKRYALLAVCRPCHEELGSAAQWPEARQLAQLAERRLADFDLKLYLELTNANAPRRIEMEEVLAHMSDHLLTVTQIADRMGVNRRTAQSWIDSKQLPAIDVRPAGAQRAMWRVEPTDLMSFAQNRKNTQNGPLAVQLGEDLLD